MGADVLQKEYMSELGQSAYGSINQLGAGN